MIHYKSLKIVFVALLSTLLLTGISLAQEAAWTTPPPISSTIWAAKGTTITLPPITKSEVVPINDIKMFYVTYGDPANPPLLLLHGGLTNGDTWVNQIPDFAKSYYVIVPDNPGQGRSTMGAQQFSIHLEATDDLALLDTLKLKQVDLLGWSDGANVGLDIAVNHPEYLRKLVVYGGNYVASGALPMDEACKKIDCDQLFAKLASEYARLSPTPQNWDAFSNAYFQSQSNDPDFSDAQLQAINVPTLVLDGIKEEIVAPDQAFKMASLIPTADLIMMGGIGHFAPVDKAAEFNHIVLDYLGR